MPDKQDCYIGLMSGTSMDGISAAAATFDSGKPQLIAGLHSPYSPSLQQTLEAVVTAPDHTRLQTLLELDHRIALEFSACALTLINQLNHYQVKAIGSHGQTVFHQSREHIHPNSWQLGDPNTIAERTGITTIADWRRRDMAAGGEGAPLTPVFHTRFLRGDQDIAVLNLGGIANITLIPATGSPLKPIGFDTGPANTLIDNWIKREKGETYDRGGEWASSGAVNKALLAALMEDPYFQKQPPKSTGREQFNLEWLELKLASFKERITPVDIQATLAELTAQSVALAVTAHQQKYNVVRLYICGGGLHNHDLINRLRRHLPDISITGTEAAGIDPDFMEAMAFAWMAGETLKQNPIDTTPFTGARHPCILGGIYHA